MKKLITILILAAGTAGAAVLRDLPYTSNVPTTAEMNTAIGSAPFLAVGSNITNLSTEGASAAQVYYADGAGGGSWGAASSPTSGISQAEANLLYAPIATTNASGIGYASDSTTNTTVAGALSEIFAMDLVQSGTMSGTNDIGVLISFTDDGNHAETKSLFVPTLLSKGVVGCLAVQPRNASNWGAGYTPSECRSLVDENGFEILSHSVNHYYMVTASNTVETIESELINSKTLIENAGITCKNFVYPYGWSDSTTRSLTRKYYRSGSQTDIDLQALASRPENGITFMPMPTYKLSRLYFGTTTGENITNAIDYAVAHGNCWLQFYVHALEATNDFGTAEAFTNALADTIDYALSQGMEVVTVNEALNRMGNVVDYGDYQSFSVVDPTKIENTFNDENNHFVLGRNGVASSTLDNARNIFNVSGYLTASHELAHNAADSITNYPSGKVTVEQYNSSDAATLGWPGAGTIVTWRVSTPSTSPTGNGWQYQEYYSYDSTSVYRREWRGVSSWGGWDSMRAGVEHIGTYAYTAALGTFTAGQTKRFVIDTTGSIDILDLNTPVLVTPERYDSTGTPSNTSGIQFHAYVYSPSSNEVYLDVTSALAKSYSNRVFYVTILDPVE